MRKSVTDEKQVCVDKKRNRSPGHMRENAYYCNLKWTFEDLVPCYCYAIKANSKTIRSQVPQPASTGKGADMSELQAHHLHVTTVVNLALVRYCQCHTGK